MLALLGLIIVSGGAVRLTGSGLGCPDWPACDNDQLVAPMEVHAMIEFINRLITGLVSVIVIAAVLGSHWRIPRRSDLVWLSWGLVAGVLAQIVLGGLVVLYELPPVLVIGHFLLSMVLLGNAVVLVWRASDRPPDRPSDGGQGRRGAAWLRPRWVATGRRPRVLPLSAWLRPRWVATGRRPRVLPLSAWLRPRWVATGVVVLTSVVIVTGTIVTGAGPHGGDEDAERIDVALRDVARIHGTSVVVLLVALAGLVWWLRKREAPDQTQFWGRTVLGVALAQGLIGYVQYFTGVPVLLVGAHIAGAALLWIVTVFLWLNLRDPLPLKDPLLRTEGDAWETPSQSPSGDPLPRDEGDATAVVPA